MDTKKRVNRIIGQLRGVERMVNEERDCSDVLQQMSAIKHAIDGLSKEIAVSSICRLVSKKESQKVERMIERAINL